MQMCTAVEARLSEVLKTVVFETEQLPHINVRIADQNEAAGAADATRGGQER